MMRMDGARRCAGWLAALAFGCTLTAHGEAAHHVADLVLRNGIVYTMHDRLPQAQAVAVTGGKITYVGSSDAVAQLIGPTTRVVDLNGKTVLPGIVDSHIHPSWGEYLHHRLCNVKSFTVEDGYSKLADCAKRAPPGDWVAAYGWYMTDNPHIGDVTLARLDAIVPDRKLAVISRDYHTVWTNSKTLREFGVTRDTPNPAGGSYGHDAAGELNGTARDAAGLQLSAAVQHDSAYAVASTELFGMAVTYLNSLGITSMVDALVDDDGEAAYHALDADGQLTMRVSLAFGVQPDNYRTEIPRIAAKRDKQSPHTRIDYVKVFADGNSEDGLANMLAEDGRRATPGYYTQQQMNDLVQLAEQYGLSIYVHVIGDGATRQVLDAIAAARKAAPCPRCRHTLTHMQWVSAADIPRFRELEVIANIQEGWLSPLSVGGAPGYDYAQATGAGPLGLQFALRMYPFRQLHDAGARVAAGSDWFFTDENPWNDIEAGITSRDPGVPDQKPMLPDHTLDLTTLLRARTIDAAYQMFDEAEAGSIEPGKQADLVVIDQNLHEVSVDRIHATKVVMTFFGGRQVFGAP